MAKKKAKKRTKKSAPKTKRAPKKKVVAKISFGKKQLDINKRLDLIEKAFVSVEGALTAMSDAQTAMVDLLKQKFSTAPIGEPMEKLEANGETEVTKEEITEVLNEALEKHGLDGIRDIIKKHGGTKLGDLPESKYASVIADVRAL